MVEPISHRLALVRRIRLNMNPITNLPSTYFYSSFIGKCVYFGSSYLISDSEKFNEKTHIRDRIAHCY